MDKIKCPHCGAMNQDVTAQDNCWNCGKPLGAAAPPLVAATVTASEANSEPGVDAGGQQLKTQATLEERVAVRKAERLAARRTSPAVYALLVLLLIALLAIFYFVVLRHH